MPTSSNIKQGGKVCGYVDDNKFILFNETDPNSYIESTCWMTTESFR